LWHIVDLPPHPAERYQQLTELTKLLATNEMMVDNLAKSISVSPSEVYRTIMPLLQYIRVLRTKAQNEGRPRVLFGIGGGGGSGKSTLAKVLMKCLNHETPDSCAVLGMDAYHLPNKILRETTIEDPLDSNAQILLSNVKGTPPSFDAQAMLEDLRRLRRGGVESISLPEYDRLEHEAVPDRVRVGPEVQVVLVEGLFVAGYRHGAWEQIDAALDAAVMVRGDEAAIKARMVERQVVQGRTLEEAETHFARVDAANYARLQECYQHARAVLHLSYGFRLQSVENVAERQPAMLVLGLNPALQKSMWVPELTKGKVHRASKVLLSVGGKGQGCARAAADCAQHAVTVAQFMGGDAGEFLQQQMATWGVEQVTRVVEGTTRTATTVVCEASGTATELIDPSAEIGAAHSDHLLDEIKELIQNRKAVTISGTCPPGVTQKFYEAVALAAPPGCTVVLDGYTNVDSVLATGRVGVLKINRDELLELTGESVMDTAAKICFEKHLSESSWLAITDGSDPATLYSCNTKWVLTLPSIKVINPIGAGDTCCGVMSYCLATQLYTAPEAFAAGLAAASASCLSEQAAIVDWIAAESLLDQISISEHALVHE